MFLSTLFQKQKKKGKKKKKKRKKKKSLTHMYVCSSTIIFRNVEFFTKMIFVGNFFSPKRK